MVRTRDRVIALVIAIAFFATSIATSVFFIMDLNSSRKEAQNNQQRETLAGTKLAGFDPIAEVTELQKIDIEVGTGDEVQPGDVVTVDYTGALAADGTIFQSSLDFGEPVTLTIKGGPDGVIEGWVEGIPGMKVGGTRRLIIPADKAYGSQARTGIPPNSALVFDVTLRKIGE
jgi:FKBP-type peptidyl-prolyl cis-trans isomerase FkpA